MSNYIRMFEDGHIRTSSGLNILTEKLSDGILSFADMRESGVPVSGYSENQMNPSFDLIINGISLYYGWIKKDYNIITLNDGCMRSVLTLENTIMPLRLEIVTDAGTEGFFTRKLRITNISDNPVTLTRIVPFSGHIFDIPFDLASIQRDDSVAIYSVGCFNSDDSNSEGNFRWIDVSDNSGISVGSTNGKSGHTHPFFICRNNLYGGYFLYQLEWSSNWRAEVYCRHQDENLACLSFSAEPVSPSPMRIIDAGETIESPHVHFGMNHESFDALINGLHKYQSGHIMKKVVPQPVIINHWGYMQHEISEEKLIEQIDIGSQIGGEMFIVDAGWYGRKGASWYQTTGDWIAGERLPHDLFPVFEHARENGMKVGLWVEVETAGKESLLASRHPDWFIKRYGKIVERILDLTNPEVEHYIETELIRLIERYKLDLVRLDYNTDALEGGFTYRNGLPENTLYRHTETIWRIFDHIREKYPDIQLENCSSGGGRTDIGMVSRFTTTWVSDCMKMPRSVRILNGMTMVLPPFYVNRMFGAAMEGSYIGSLDAQLQVIIMGHPAISGIAPGLNDINPDAIGTIKKYIDIYKNDIRPMHSDMKVYHHTPELKGVSGEGWCALEYASSDRSLDVAAVFRQYNADSDSYRLRFKGLAPDRNYSVRVEPSGDIFRADGLYLSENGVEVRLDNNVTSRMFILKSTE